jgi:acylphosphatase
VSEVPIRRRVVVHGLVQGVNFRHGTRREAAAHGVAGWVRNRVDGTVEAVFEGERGAVSALVAFCRRGPRSARVENVELHEEEHERLRGFEIR